MTLSPTHVLNNRYRIVQLLGQGGFGAVYRAWDLNLERQCAVKENFGTSEEAQRQFKREAIILADLSHPNLPRVIDHFILPDQGQYLVMDYVAGEDLGAMLKRAGGPLPEAQILPWIVQVCDALTHLHNHYPPIIHRDIKPANIRVTPEGKAFLVDFGISKLLDSSQGTLTGARAFTPGYSPPEQYGLAATDAQSDVYALGATVYHLVTGSRPPSAVDITAGVAGTLLPARQVNPSVSPHISAALENAMQLIRSQRTPSVQAFKAALTAPATQGVRVMPATPSTRQAPASAAPATLLTRQAPASTAPATPLTRQAPASAVPASVRPERRSLSVSWPGMLAITLVLACVGLAAGGWIAWRVLSEANSGRGAAPTEVGGDLTRLPVETSFETATAQPSPTVEIVVPTLPVPTSPVPTSPVPTPTSPVPTATPPVDTPTAIPSFTPTTIAVRIADSLGVEMVLIPAGDFQMGSRTGDSDEQPVHKLYLDAFYMDVYEVTNTLYRQCVDARRCAPLQKTDSTTREKYYSEKAYNRYPVIHANWDQARAFCQWRGGSLPTEAQWEKAALGGVDGRLYPWGNEGPVCQAGEANGAQFASCMPFDTVQVGSFSPNAYGLYDMAGNVWEWVLDWYSENYYGSSPSANPTGPGTGLYRTVRGGAFDLKVDTLRVANRSRDVPDDLPLTIGFRCVRLP